MQKENPPKLPTRFKFLRRNLNSELSVVTDKLLTKANLKKIYFKGIFETKYDKTINKEHRRKEINSLTNLTLILTSKHQHCINMAKKAKSLKTLRLESDNPCKINFLLPIIRKFTKNIQNLTIITPLTGVTSLNLRHLYNNPAFPELKVFHRQFTYDENAEQLVGEEYKTMNRWLSRMKHPVKLHISASQPEIQGAFKNEQSCFNMIELCLKLSLSDLNTGEYQEENSELAYSEDNYDWGGSVADRAELSDVIEHYADSAGEDEKNDSDLEDIENAGNENENEVAIIENSELKSKSDKEKTLCVLDEMVFFFKLYLFPNLQKLSLVCTEMCQLDLFVIEGFRSLKKLEHLTLTFEARPLGTKYLFEGLIQLPLLKGFSIWISFIREDEDDLFHRFLLCQTQLVSLSVTIYGFRSTKNGYYSQNKCLTNICSSLSTKHDLKYLSLDADHWTLETLAKGLMNIGTMEHLKELSIRLGDDCLTSQVSASDRVEGFCDFVKKHKASLRSLSIIIDFVREEVITERIVEALAELEELRKLYFVINSEIFEGWKKPHVALLRKEFSLNVRKELNKRVPCYNRTFTELQKVLRRMAKLEVLFILLDKFNYVEEPSEVHSSSIINALIANKYLGSLTLFIPYIDESFRRYPDELLELFELRTVKSLDVSNFHYSLHGEKERIIKEVKLRNSLRSELMF